MRKIPFSIIFLALQFSVSTHFLLQGQSSRILLDEDFSDWQNVPVAFSDAEGDQGNSLIDFGRLWMSNDEDYLFFRLEVGTEINLQSNNEISIYLDADNDASTGLSVNGIGAELEYNLGNRVGLVRLGGNGFVVRHHDLGLVSAPTVTSTEFEIAIRRDLTFSGQPLFSGNSVEVVFKNAVSNGDVLPEDSGGVIYSFQTTDLEPLPSFSIDKIEESHLRILTYNVEFDGFFDPNNQPHFSRIFKALKPEIIGFQEIYDHSASQTAAVVESFLPSAPGEQWYSEKIEPDIIAVSRFPISWSFRIQGSNSSSSGNGAFLIDLGAGFDSELLFMVAHPPCCDNNSNRQLEFDAMMAFLRDAQNGNGAQTISAQTPVVIVGDMNLVGFQLQQETLLTGNIFNQSIFGNDFNPDWDGTPLEDAKPFTTNLPMNITWYSEFSSFGPGRLDYVVYTGSVMQLKNSFSLFTPALSSDLLNSHNLQAEDAIRATDHLPLVADFEIGVISATQKPPTGSHIFAESFPNPFSQSTTLIYRLPGKSRVSVMVLDQLGRQLMVLEEGIKFAGEHSLMIDGGELAAGVYFIRVATDFGVVTRKLIVH